MKIKTAGGSIDPQLRRRGVGVKKEKTDGLWEQLKLAPSRKNK